MKELLDKDAAKIEFEEFKKFIEDKGTYRAALFYASQNQKIRWDGGFNKFLKEILVRDKNITSFEMVKMIL
ncbi:hypothetical protein B0S90_1661 [Caldicellulosiruptor bescii]|uniref:Uncharacterized protein n=2 Tax=Caldicellulosiruptor bescii TaxID=31899 RepID=B9MS12_CALBD|nr:hypothetical protein [Caldicellulosiruptor bescii]ACM60466.1 hypothetical protein Athe_1366 [Caldicellulosiruptor bescii DSM 6725]ACM60468.1 hypothetical protein Athe_1368 [Caldicellulosiruptor bescii DSM 6725]PBC87880.1 hypothetical protein B0S87_0799 [Caldicellulosiruptor bescii]PBC87882.1 hypothetical protein B0S87_0801 [Caldicellulosiruptor bescii]PBC90812.1 hypothetical protein B0S89_1161 [Caldicellulosiruptor bescii]